MGEEAPAEAPKIDGQATVPNLPMTGPPLLKRVFDCLIKINRNPERDCPWDDVIAFYKVFDMPFEDEEQEALFKKKFNPEGNANIPSDRATMAMFEIVKKEGFVKTLATDAKILDIKTHGTVHAAPDFRYMLSKLGEDLSDQDYDDFIREAMGKQDETFDLEQYINFMCSH